MCMRVWLECVSYCPRAGAEYLCRLCAYLRNNEFIARYFTSICRVIFARLVIVFFFLSGEFGSFFGGDTRATILSDGFFSRRAVNKARASDYSIATRDGRDSEKSRSVINIRRRGRVFESH